MANALKLSNPKAFWKTIYQHFFNHSEGKIIRTENSKAFGRQDIKISSIILKVRAFKLCNSKAF